MPIDVGDYELRFDELPLELRLEGFPEGLARFLAQEWVCPIRISDPDSDSYRIRLRMEPRLGFRSTTPKKPARPIRLRTRTQDSITELRMPGARTLLRADHRRAEVEVHPRLSRDLHRMELATGGALGHALALAGASFLHGASFRVHDLSILLLGGPGSGKSTAAAAALAAAGRLVSDDSLILSSRASDQLQIRTLRSDLLLREGSLEVLPDSMRQRLRGVGSEGNPRWVLVRQETPGAFCQTLEPSVVCVLRRDLRLKSFRLVPLSQAEALRALLEANSSPHLLHPAFRLEQQRLLQLWSRLTARLPAYELRLGPAVLDLPEQVMGEIVTRLRTLGTRPL